MTALTDQLALTRRWLLVRRAAVEGLLARLMIERSAMAQDRTAGQLRSAADRAVVIGDLEMALAIVRGGAVNQFIAAMERNAT